MASVEAQMEANGLPTQFDSTSNEPNVSHAVTNATATISNSEISEMKTNAPDLEVTAAVKPVQPAEDSQPSVEEAVTQSNDVSLASDTNVLDTAEVPSELKVNGHHTVSDSAASTQVADAPVTVDPPQPVAPSEEQPSTTVTEKMDETTATTIPTGTETETEPRAMSDQPQPQISDLRTAPHSDHLSPEAVATIEAEKHDIDNRADQVLSDVPPPSAESNAQPVDDANSNLQVTPSVDIPPEPIPDTTTSEVNEIVTLRSLEAVNPSIPGEAPVDPAPTPVAPVKAPSPEPTQSQDQEMTDAPALPAKLVHQREEDQDMEEPAPKRVKTDEHESPPTEQSSFKIPESPAPQNTTAATSDQPSVDDTVTPSRLGHMKKVISNLKKSNASSPFRLPVDPVSLKIPTYFDVVKNPMDLHTIDDKLKKNEYKSVEVFKRDFNQIIENCILFNGPDHTITQQGRKMEQSFNNQMSNLPPVGNDEPSKIDKKPTKPKIEPIRAAAPRRTSINAKAASPKATPSPATFAPDPSGMPLIRRDSAMDGRPKRAIVPPKRNSDFGGARPKKKKYELELKFCDEVLKTISSPKHWTINQYFTHPVDPVSLNIPTYFQVVKKPMDLGTVRQNLDGGMYERAKDFEEDVRLIFKNCYKFNQEGDYVYQRGQELEKLFSSEWNKKQEWIAAREPESEPTSVVGDYDEEAVSEEEEELESEEDDRSAQIEQLQQQIEAMQKQMGQLAQKKPKKKSPGASSKKTEKKKVKKEVPKTQFPGLKPNKPKKAPSKPKTEKDRYVTFAEKQYISNGIALLPERQMSEALKIIQNSVPALANSDQNEIELDIEEVPNHALLKLLTFVKKYAGPPPEEPREETYSAPSVNKKKNRMSRQEQDDQIASLRGTLHNYQEGGSPDAIQSIETGGDDSEDDESNEESEEE